MPWNKKNSAIQVSWLHLGESYLIYWHLSFLIWKTGQNHSPSQVPHEDHMQWLACKTMAQCLTHCRGSMDCLPSSTPLLLLTMAGWVYYYDLSQSCPLQSNCLQSPVGVLLPPNDCLLWNSAFDESWAFFFRLNSCPGYLCCWEILLGPLAAQSCGSAVGITS